ncbi:MAG: lipopolysaccharide core heptose(II) kinase RfaY [Cytophagales bacterium]|nr:AarF/UbiB family protein [Bernardetiaceae bacterium]MDW8211598.1 lipopolysaccharide core heptose(II) kinase RfaY [Cytophagales bacterium]
MAEEKPIPQESIPVTKVERAARFVKTGVKIGGNYIKHYAKKLIDGNVTKEDLHRDNAEDIYDALSELKGSALKVAQMMSMDKNLLPTAYQEKFAMAQYSAPPLSYPLVVKTFQQYFSKSPTEIFDTFTKEAVNAASIGQVHKATKGDKTFAVKVQYPGVAESIKSDLRMVRPFAVQILGLNERDLDLYMDEVQNMLIAETDYELEMRNATYIASACAHIPHLVFPKYYPEYTAKRILTMDWLTGKHLNDFLQDDPPQQIRNQLGQALWNFYDYQMHQLLMVHADPHPGNFLMRPDGTIGIIDFGCVKVIPPEYYKSHFRVINPRIFDSRQELEQTFYDLGFIYDDDPPAMKKLLIDTFSEMIYLTVRPFREKVFDFGDQDYFRQLYEFGERLSKMEELRKSKKPRGSKDALYLNRTYFGLYSMLHSLKAVISTHTSWQ